LKEGDTPSWFFFLSVGGNNPADPSQPGWGGRFDRNADGWFHDFPARDDFSPPSAVSRWRSEFQADVAKRMQWCQG